MKYVTFLNTGCVDICRNMLVSADRVGISQDDFYIGCLDTASFDAMKKRKNTFLHVDQGISHYQNWTYDGDTGFRKIHYYKWPIIKRVYQEHKNLCWVDTDIVFLKDPTPLLANRGIFCAQNDYPGLRACGGFLVFNDSPSTAALINDMAANDFEDDQILLNRFLDGPYKGNFEQLSQHEFPNGKIFYEPSFKNDLKNTAYIVHNNWIVGIDDKISRFKEEGYWYL